MGTLFNQPPRDYRGYDRKNALNLIEEIREVADQAGIEFSEALRIYELLEKSRSTDVYVDNGNIFDEQMAGIGELLKEISESIEKIADQDSD
jgi:hypothetical protein